MDKKQSKKVIVKGNKKDAAPMPCKPLYSN